MVTLLSPQAHAKILTVVDINESWIQGNSTEILLELCKVEARATLSRCTKCQMSSMSSFLAKTAMSDWNTSTIERQM